MSNNELADAFARGSRLPENVQNMGRDIIDGLRGKYGEDIIPRSMTWQKLMRNNMDFITKVKTLPQEGRDEALRSLITEQCMQGVTSNAMDNNLNALCKKLKVNIASTSKFRIINNFFKTNPDMKKNLSDCADAQAITRLLQTKEQELTERILLTGKVEEAEKNVNKWAAELMQQKTGYASDAILETCQFNELHEDVLKLSAGILSGKDGNVPGFDVEGAFRNLAEKFADTRASLIKQLDTLASPPELSPQCKQSLKTQILQIGFPKNVNIQHIVEAGSDLGTHLQEKINAGITRDELVSAMHTLIRGCQLNYKNLMGEETWNKLDVNSTTPLLMMALKVIYDTTPGLTEAIRNGLGPLEDLPDMTQATLSMCFEAMPKPDVQQNADLARQLRSRDVKDKWAIPTHVYQGLWNGASALEQSFGKNGLPAGMPLLLDQKVPGLFNETGTNQMTVREAIAKRIGESNVAVTAESLGKMLQELLLPVARERSLAEAVRQVGAKLQPPVRLTPKDMNRITTQLHVANPKLETLNDANAIIKELQGMKDPNISDMVLAVHHLRTAWEGIRDELATQISKTYGLQEPNVQENLRNVPDLYDAFFALGKNERTNLLKNGKFRDWSTKLLQERISAMSSAIISIKEADLPEKTRTKLINQTLSCRGGVEAQDIDKSMKMAGPAAGNIDATRLMRAAQGKKVQDAAILAALDAFEERVQNAYPQVGGETGVFLRDQIRQAFLQQHKDLADKLARIPAEQLSRLSKLWGASPERLALLHAARGRAAENWLHPRHADAIADGTASLETEQHLDNVLRHGETLFREFSPRLPQEQHGLLRGLIGMCDLSSKESLAASRLQVSRMAGLMPQWASFGFDDSPIGASTFLKQQLSSVKNDIEKNEKFENNISKSFQLDAQRSVITINGTSFNRNQEDVDTLITAFKNAVTPGHDDPLRTEEQKEHDEKVQRFLSSLIQQSSWVPLIAINQMKAKLGDFQLHNDVGMEIIAKRSDTEKGFEHTPLFNSAENMHNEIIMSEDGKTATVRLSSTFIFNPNIAGKMGREDLSMGGARYTQEIKVNLEFDPPTIIAVKMSQQLMDNMREVLTP